MSIRARLRVIFVTAAFVPALRSYSGMEVLATSEEVLIMTLPSSVTVISLRLGECAWFLMHDTRVNGRPTTAVARGVVRSARLSWIGYSACVTIARSHSTK